MQISSIAEVIKFYNENRKRRFVFVGKGGSGKDHARKLMESLGYKYQISFTTRPPRSTEVHGKDYFFTYNEKFKDLINLGFFYEHVEFNGWLYGTSKYQMDTLDSLFIMTPKGLEHMIDEDRASSLVVYFDIDEDTRRQRISLRSDADTVERRLEADDKDFYRFQNYDLVITNPEFSLSYDVEL